VRKRRTSVGGGSGNVFADLGFENADEELTKARLTTAIAKAIKNKRFKRQSDVAAVLGIDQPKVSKLLRGHFAEYSVGRLLGFLTRLGYDVKIKVADHAHSRRPGHLEVIDAA
jgi:predicted XRE-type DNA-binding protein